MQLMGPRSLRALAALNADPSLPGYHLAHNEYDDGSAMPGKFQADEQTLMDQGSAEALGDPGPGNYDQVATAGEVGESSQDVLTGALQALARRRGMSSTSFTDS